MTLKKVYQTKDIYPTFQTEHDAVEADVSEELAKLKFSCGQNVRKNNCCFSHIIGLPQHPATMQPMKFMPHQSDLDHLNSFANKRFKKYIADYGRIQLRK